MSEYRITPKAFEDLDEIRSYLELKAGERVADRVETRLFAKFEELARLKAVGHRRKDMRQPDLLFERQYRYVILFRREPQVVVLRVLHGARDIANILKKI